MTRFVLLSIRMLRYRVAAMIWMFMLLGAASTGGLQGVGVGHLCATVALAASYVAATTVNDLADERIDKVNHPGDLGRPLVIGHASRRDLVVIHAVACAVALVASAMIDWAAVAIIALSLSMLQLFVAAIAWMLHRLRLAPANRGEQVAIGLGARMGNGLLLTTLSWLTLEQNGAPDGDRLLFAAIITAVVGIGFLVLARRPDQAVLGYKG